MRYVYETPLTDLSGSDLFPGAGVFNTIRASDGYLVSPLTLGTMTHAYMQVGSGSVSDADTFAMNLDAGDTYRVIFSTPRTQDFLSNRMMSVYDTDGRYHGLIMNNYGTTFSPTGTLTSSTFTASQSGSYLLFAQLYNRNGNVTADYGLTLEKVADVTPWDISLTRYGMGAKAVITAGDAIIPAGTQVTISITFATANLRYEDFSVLFNGSYSSSTSSSNNSTTLYITLASSQSLTLRDLIEVRFNGGGVAGTLQVTQASVRIGSSYPIVDYDPTFTTPGNKVLSGTALSDLLTGDIGNDRLSGLAGNDTLNGGGGNDTLIGGVGIDRMVGGAGNDVYYVDNAGDRVIEAANQGIDLVYSMVSHTLAAYVENLNLAGSTGLSGTGNGLGNLINGNGGNNRLSGLDGNDTLNGGAGNDTLEGGTGHDVLNGGAGIDRMSGGMGNDVYHVDNLGDVVIETANQGTDLVQSTVNHTLAANVENLLLLGAAGLSGTGNGLGNLITGNAGSNRLNGLGGNDTLNGAAGNDTLDGGAGSDQLNGGAGNDLIIGGAGADRLSGGIGADRFVFSALSDSTLQSAGRDTITDFTPGQRDLIDLSAIDASTRAAGNQAFRYIGDAAFTGAAGELSARLVSGGTLISGDVNGDKIADFAILLDDRLSLGADSFIL